MHYVKHFNINGVDTKQVACIELQGKPNAATEGAVGVLGMDMTSPTHEVYRCIAVNGSVYTWELLSAGMSIISATITGEGGMTKSFPYSALLIPNNYLIKMGDLILDSEGYLYQINSIGVDSCNASYCGTHIGGMASGDKDCSLVVSNGKLQLVTESGSILSEVDYSKADNSTIYREPSTGSLYVMGVKTVNGGLLRFFVGDRATYNTLTEEQQQNLFAIITDDPSRDNLLNLLSQMESGSANAVSLETDNYMDSESDFNDYIYLGNYACVDNVTFHTLKNAPLNASAGSLRVISGTGGKVDVETTQYLYLLQIYMSFTGAMYIRTMTRESGVWTYGRWQQFAGEGSQATVLSGEWVTELIGRVKLDWENPSIYVLRYGTNTYTLATSGAYAGGVMSTPAQDGSYILLGSEGAISIMNAASSNGNISYTKIR